MAEATKKILLVEDEALIAFDEKKELEKSGFYTVCIAESGKKAIEQIKNNSEISLVLMDINLDNEMDGTDAAVEILKIREIPIIFLTSHSEKEYVEKVKKITPYGYVLKNSGPFVLQQSITMAFDLFESNRSNREHDHLLKTTIQSIGDAVITTDHSGVVTYLNPVAEKLCGWLRSEAFGQKLEDVFVIINAKTRETVENPVHKVFTTGKVVGLANHTLLISKDGNEYQIADSASPIDDNGTTIGVVLVFRDVTKEYAVRQESEERKERFNSLFGNMQEGVALHKLCRNSKGEVYDYQIIEVNYQYEKILGIKHEDVIGKVATELYQTTPAPYIKEYSHCAIDKEPFVFTTYFPPMDKYFSISVAPWGKDGFATIFTDITEQVHFNETIQQSEKKFRSIFDNINAALALHEIVLDDDGEPVDFIFLDVNSVYETTTGLKRENVIGKKGKDVLPNIEDKWIDIYGKVALNGKAVTIEEHSEYLDKYWEVKAFSPEKMQFAVELSDITERIRREERQQAIIKEKELILKEVHHRVKNDMFIIQSILDLHSKSIENTEAGEALADARSRVGVLFSMYQYLYMDKNFSSLSIDSYLSNLLKNIKDTYCSFSGITIQHFIEDISLDTKHVFPLGIIINELINNAFKYAFPDIENGIIKLTIKTENDLLYITVADNGIGIQDLETALEPETFGFQLIDSLVQQHNGAYSVVNCNGTAIEVILSLK